MQQFNMTPERPELSRLDIKEMLEESSDADEFTERLEAKGLTAAEVSKILSDLDSY